jgi:hypothetical protein
VKARLKCCGSNPPPELAVGALTVFALSAYVLSHHLLTVEPEGRMEEIKSYVKCPRCAGAVIINGVGAISRATRGDGAPIIICARCGERESLYERDPARQIPFTAWPVDIETILAEEENVIHRYRNGQARAGGDRAGAGPGVARRSRGGARRQRRAGAGFARQRPALRLVTEQETLRGPE